MCFWRFFDKRMNAVIKNRTFEYSTSVHTYYTMTVCQESYRGATQGRKREKHQNNIFSD